MGAFFIMSISAYYLVRNRHVEFARRSFTGALIFATVFSLLQLVSGHSNAGMVAHNQPAKLAAFEGVFQTGPADISIVGWPDTETRSVRFNVAVPGLLSFLVFGDTTTPVIGLDKFPRELWPPVAPTFASYHIMVGIGGFFVVLTVFATLLRWRGTLFEKRWLLWVFVGSVLLAVAANQLGWAAAELGRQPWTVHPGVVRDDAGQVRFDDSGYVMYRADEGLLTSKAVSEAVAPEQVLGSIIMFGLIYLLLAAIWVFVLNHKIHAGPAAVHEPAATTSQGLLAAAAARTQHDASMSEAKQPANGEGAA
jgi:cytochrome d ubiquinol oxidase subunit I